MPRLITLGLVSLTALTAMIGTADAQNRRRVVVREQPPLVLRVRPRSFLEPGTVVPAGSLERQRSGYWQTQSYLVSPPWNNMRDRFGEGALPDPIHGVFIGARNPFGPVDYGAPAGLR
ncbi:MAG TPA: hypothetical protein VHK66_05110 [Microvirga sp.]|jgi:hypothetical protein|nr:hypothetical protein [Microvirga sp.]